LSVWLERAPNFQAGKIDTPLRIEAIAKRSLPGEWETYALLRMRGVPTEMFYYPDGYHELQKPLEQLNSQGGNTDWFSFWINGYEDLDSAKAEQYKRWRKLRTDWEALGGKSPKSPTSQ
jgi:hypothetical protein